MKLYPNRLVRLVLLLSVMVGLVACKPNPQDDIALFQPFITENINKKSDDPYISSTVKPGDKMYEILVNIQHGRHNIAANKLKIMIKENDIDAMVWYAKLIYRTSINNRPKALSLYQKAMDNGNPYAYIMLSPGLVSSGCVSYFGVKNCTLEHFNKAIELFKPLAAQGDLRAQYFLLKQQQLDQSKETRAQYIQEVIRFAQAHYYQPLMDYVNTILIYSPSKGKSEAKTVEQYQLAIDLLTIAANHNYIPAVNDLAFFLKETAQEESERLRGLGLKLGSTSAVKYKYHRSNEGSEDEYFYNALYKNLSGEYAFSSRNFNEEEKETINGKVKLFMNDITPMVYIDGFTSRDDWVD
ncbi:sel1 repeat family protein [Vibrio aestuarianus]|uniref:sel1 repeat family protein n=1 Tax=Vibrio aestuarianus TaxID=28171 RepID=UPI00237D2E69|nr:sel1 repeat family protein [Vibrio aestuarianus]MDE1266214.1 sel1 repeat family protein [Vibrio aestuarianus]MDE1298365.1 sel1 repeat family protein [Vibrio aestuarianus]